MIKLTETVTLKELRHSVCKLDEPYIVAVDIKYEVLDHVLAAERRLEGLIQTIKTLRKDSAKLEEAASNAVTAQVQAERTLQDKDHEVQTLKSHKSKLETTIRHLERQNETLRNQVQALEQDKLSESW